MTESDLCRWRDEFPITQRTNYLISNSTGAMPRAARQAIAEFMDLWDTRGVCAWDEGWWTTQDGIARLLGPILGADPSGISLHPNVTIASAVFASAIDFAQGRNKIVFTDMNFPSLIYLYEGIARQRGAVIDKVASEDGVTVPTERLLDAIDERTALVPISHVLFRSSWIQDAQAIIAKARRVGAIVLLDVFQSVGTVPLQLAEWGCHAAVGGALKFLCGGPGTCFLWVDSELAPRLTPAFTGWLAHRTPFEFDAGKQLLREDGWRFMHGTPNIPGLYAAREGIRILGQIGIERVRAQSMRQTTLLIEGARERGLSVNAPVDPAQRGGTVAIDVPHGREVCDELLARDILCDYRPRAGIRLAPHFYTLDCECTGALDAIAEILESGAWRR